AQRPPARHLEEGGHRRLEIGDQRGPYHLRPPGRVRFSEGGSRRLDLHGVPLRHDVCAPSPRSLRGEGRGEGCFRKRRPNDSRMGGPPPPPPPPPRGGGGAARCV